MKQTDMNANKKNQNGLLLVVLMIGLVLGGALGYFVAQTKQEPANEVATVSDDMKMEYRYDYQDGGASTVERLGDHADSPYFYDVDFYNAESTDSLFILPQFQTKL